MRCSRAALVLLALVAPVAWPQPPTAGESAAAATRPADPYSGVVVNDTVTFIGQEFYSVFVAGWREEPNAERFTVTVRERPSARWGSLISVEYLHREVFRAFLSPGRRDFVRTAASDASRIVYDNVVNTEVQRLLFRDPDIAADEF